MIPRIVSRAIKSKWTLVNWNLYRSDRITLMTIYPDVLIQTLPSSKRSSQLTIYRLSQVFLFGLLPFSLQISTSKWMKVISSYVKLTGQLKPSYWRFWLVRKRFGKLNLLNFLPVNIKLLFVWCFLSVTDYMNLITYDEWI